MGGIDIYIVRFFVDLGAFGASFGLFAILFIGLGHGWVWTILYSAN